VGITTAIACRCIASKRKAGIIVNAGRGDKNIEALGRFSPTHAGIKRRNPQISVAQIGFIELNPAQEYSE
jgi:hypothetical protein